MVLLFLVAGSLLMGYDVARLTIGGGWAGAVACWLIAAALSGLFRREAWIGKKAS